MDNVMTFLALLVLFIFTASILGMNLFGGKYLFEDEDGGNVTARANFDDLFWALVTVFQVKATRFSYINHILDTCDMSWCKAKDELCASFAIVISYKQ